MITQPKENYVHEFFRIFFANRQLVKRVFLAFAVIAVLLPLLLKQSYDVTAEVIVQSKKLSQSDTSSALAQEADQFIPPSLADMETESNILRSPTLIRETINQLRKEGHYQTEPGLLQRTLFTPLHNAVVAPVERLFASKPEESRDTELDVLTEQAVKNLTVETLPGSNVISVMYSAEDPKLGTLFVARLLDNFLKNRQDLQSNELPEAFYEQKKLHYQARLGDLESQRLGLLTAIGSSDPKEEITFRLNAINTEEQALNLQRDRQLQNSQWLDYLQTNLAAASKAKMLDYAFPYTFTTTVDNVAFEDREIKQLGEQLTTQTARYNADLTVFQPGSEQMLMAREQIAKLRGQFLKIVGNRIRERQQDLAVTQQVIDQKTQRIAEYKDRIHQLRETQSKTRQLDTEIEALHKAFSTYAQRYEESRGQGLLDGSQSNARILSAPYEPTAAAFPKPGLIIPFGLVTGLLLAIAIVYVREFFDRRFKHPAQITHQLDLPVLLVINDQTPALPNPHKAWTLPRLVHWVRN
ncbi:MULTISPECIES: GumC family protein [unclassified Pseudomonas]|uniref:GumC family protein n=1 Tax=unclassified Pseudomonas TaxID=196821 RepID=UPI0021BB2D7B|nr:MULTISPECIES: Wzz/FepE/Etk N-terminal domain-containing protein [unclassified Pseudomonas]MCT8163375.1 lipopolysaccharide biosynthesis protein [Pseudomonas sp. HD6422]MCT8182285.1 lipopolysaccharide biosynthesis protein [Pseudomonas sp. HD6421]